MRLIDADALKEIMCAECDNKHLCADKPACDTVREIDSMPSIEAEPERGRWIREPNCWYRCSVCGKHYPSISDNMKYNYCPNCGARVGEVENE